jgi:hypothetical protein
MIPLLSHITRGDFVSSLALDQGNASQGKLLCELLVSTSEYQWRLILYRSVLQSLTMRPSTLLACTMRILDRLTFAGQLGRLAKKRPRCLTLRSSIS